jgi:NAD(P)H-hydrate epimerase
MKLLSAKQIKEADAFTIQNEPIASIDLMERAAAAFVQKFLELFNVFQLPVSIVAGVGNNGADGLAVARLLHQNGAKPIVFIVGEKLKATQEFSNNLKRLHAQNTPIIWVENKTHLQQILNGEVIIDAILGTGLSRSADGLYKNTIELINQSNKIVVSIDVPSGLNCDAPNAANDAIIYATHTITFEQPKLSFLFAESGKFCGLVHVVDIGLNKSFLEQVNCVNFLTQKTDIASLKIFHRSKFSHKGTFGHLALAAGSFGKGGAAVLSAKAAMKSGVGLLTVLSPKANVSLLQSAVCEAMCIADEEQNLISSIEASFATAFAVGPGIGTHEKTSKALLSFLLHNQKPLVLDADAINILAQQHSLENLFANETVITPHPKEFDRIAGNSSNSFDRLQKAKLFSSKHNVVVVLKGAHTAVIHPNGNTFFNSTGNAGMATAGSGDVLTGIIGSFLAQGLSAFDAAIAGVYLHGLAGDCAAKEKTEMCLTASDLIYYLPLAVKQIAA